MKPIQTLDHAALLDAWDFLSQRFFRRLDAEMTAHAQALERGVYRAYCVAAVKEATERQKADATSKLLTELARRDAADATSKPPSAPKQDAEVVWALVLSLRNFLATTTTTRRN